MQFLSKQDLQRWLDASTNQPKIGDDFLPWIDTSLRAFFPFAKLFMAHGELIAGGIKTTHWRAIGHEVLYLEQLETTFELEQRGSMFWWFMNRQPFVIDPALPPPFTTKFELEEIQTC